LYQETASPKEEVIFDENVEFYELGTGVLIPMVERSMDFSAGDVIHWEIDSHRGYPINVLFFKETPWQLLFKRENCVRESGDYKVHASGAYLFRLSLLETQEMPHEPFEVRLRVSKIR
jgi:hypothetical protein